MPSTSKTTQFRFSTATLMIAPMSIASGINVVDHSIGRIKNFQITKDTDSIELTQRNMSQVVASVVNKLRVECSTEIELISGFDAANDRANVLGKINTDPPPGNQMFTVRILGMALYGNPVGIHLPKCKVFPINFAKVACGLPFTFEALTPLIFDVGYSADFSEPVSVFVPRQ